MRGRLALVGLVTLLLAGLAVPAAADDPVVITFKCCEYSQTAIHLSPGGSLTVKPAADTNFSAHPLKFFDGDAVAAGTTPVTRTFNDVGLYTFICTLHGSFDGQGKPAGMGGIVRVSNNQPPHAVFTVSPDKPAAGQAVTLDASGSTDDHGITSYQWDFNGDGRADETSAKPTTTHTFKKTTTVALTVIDDNADAAGPEPGTTTKVVTLPAAKVALVTTSLHLADLRAGRAKLTFSGPAAGRASATVNAGATTIATGKTTFTSGSRHSVALKLTAAGKARLKGAKSVALKISLAVTDATGAKSSKSLSLSKVK